MIYNKVKNLFNRNNNKKISTVVVLKREDKIYNTKNLKCTSKYHLLKKNNNNNSNNWDF
jgi:hypothetical protein